MFSIQHLEKATVKPPKYYISTDCYDNHISAYIFSRKVDDTVEVLLSRSLQDEKIFQQEVQFLSKLFNHIIEFPIFVIYCIGNSKITHN